MPISLRRALTLALLSALSLAAAGCGSDGSSSTSTAGTAASTAAATATATAPAESAASAFPVTVTDKLGTVEIPSEPERIVTLDFPSTDAVLALGQKPVGMYEVAYVDGGIQEWTQRQLDELGGDRPELINTDSGFPFEQIAALKPDLIIGTNTYPLVAESYDKLSAIAPTIAHVGEPGVDSWQQGVETIGTALGRTEEAEALIASAEDEVAAVRDANPAFDGKTISFFNYVPGDALYVINSDDDFSMKFLIELGFAGIPESVAALKGQTGRAPVAEERYDELDADVVMGTSPDPAALEELEQSPTFARVPAVADGHWLGLGIGPATAMAFPSVLSVPYTAKELAPQLADALQ